MKIKEYRDLEVWQKAMDLVKYTYEIIKKLPNEERYALADQMRRSAISVPSNIAEGFERNGTKEYIQFLYIANGSRAELMTQMQICKMLNYVEDIEKVELISDEVGKMINGLIRKLKSKLTTTP